MYVTEHVPLSTNLSQNLAAAHTPFKKSLSERQIASETPPSTASGVRLGRGCV